MIRLVWRTDVHMSDRNPASRKDNWTEAVFAKLEQGRKVAAKVKAAAVIDGGDFFHIKSPSRNSHKLVAQVANHHRGYPCPVYCTPGNHDNVYGDYANLPQQPLGVLYESGIFRRLYDEHEVVFEQDGVKVRVVGIPYHGTTYDLERFTSIQKGDEDYLVCVAHVLASAKGGTMFEGEDIMKYRELATMAPDMWLLGHWHKDQGVQVIDGTQFVNIGSLTRGSLAQDDVKRRPAIALLTFTKAEAKVQVLRLRVGDVEDVFDFDARVREEARSMTMDGFVDTIRETLLEKKSESLTDAVGDMDGVPEQVRERALGYLERAG